MRIAWLVMVCLVGTAAADSGKDAAKLFDEGRDLAKTANYQEACDRFAKSYELDPAAGTAVNFADCQEHLGKLARAVELFDAAGKQADRDHNAVRAQYARDRAKVLRPRLGVVVIKLPDDHFEHVTVTIGERSIAPAVEIHELADPGDIDIVVAAPERRFATTAHVAAGQTSSIDVPAFHAANPGRDRGYVIAAIVLGGAGVASLVVSGLFGLDGQRFYTDAFTHGQCFSTATGPACTQQGLQTVATAHSRENVGTGFFIAGAALVATGIGVYVLAPSHGLEVAPAASTSSASVTLSGQF